MFKKFYRSIILLLAINLSQNVVAESDTSTVAPIVNYIPNRILDFTDIFNLGISFGPTLGIDFSISDKIQIGYMAYSGTGYTWMGRKKIRQHNGSGQTYGIFLYRRNSSEEGRESTFLRDEYRVSLQVGFGLVQLYGAIKLDELVDFVLGLFLIDIKVDDERTQAYIPFSKLARGIKNVAFGALEIPYNILEYGELGAVDGYVIGILNGVSRFIQRELVGLYEIATFFIPQESIIYPEAPFDSPSYEWQYNWDGV